LDRRPRRRCSRHAPTDQGKLYCCAIKDLLSNRIVGDALDADRPAS